MSADPKTALSYVPVVLGQLDADGKDMFATIMQAQREGGYEDGFKDGRGYRPDNTIANDKAISLADAWADDLASRDIHPAIPVVKALFVVVLTKATRDWLVANDPKAFEQITEAINEWRESR